MESTKYRYGKVRELTKEKKEEILDTRTAQFVISTEQRDRYRTVLPIDKWELDNFNAGGVVGYQHEIYGGGLCNNSDPDLVLGPGRAWVEDRQLIGEVRFEPEAINKTAETILQKVAHGTLRTSSVGALTKEGAYGEGDQREGGPDETYYFGGQELLEWSIVNIPGNPGAQLRSVRDHTYNALMYTYRALGGEFSLSDIEKMTVRNVLDLLQGKKETVTEEVEEKIERNLPHLKAVGESEMFEILTTN